MIIKNIVIINLQLPEYEVDLASSPYLSLFLVWSLSRYMPTTPIHWDDSLQIILLQGTTHPELPFCVQGNEYLEPSFPSFSIINTDL